MFVGFILYYRVDYSFSLQHSIPLHGWMDGYTYNTHMLYIHTYIYCNSFIHSTLGNGNLDHFQFGAIKNIVMGNLAHL